MAPPCPKLPVSVLNELCQKVREPKISPIYTELRFSVQSEGSEIECFKSRVTLGDLTAVSVSNCKKKAKHSAAKCMLKKILDYNNTELSSTADQSKGENIIKKLSTLLHQCTDIASLFPKFETHSTVDIDKGKLPKSQKNSVPVAFTYHSENQGSSTFLKQSVQSNLSLGKLEANPQLNNLKDPRKKVSDITQSSLTPSIQLHSYKWFPPHQSGIPSHTIPWKLIPLKLNNTKTMEMPKLTVNTEISPSFDSGESKLLSDVIIEINSDDDDAPPVLRVEKSTDGDVDEEFAETMQLTPLSRKRRSSECINVEVTVVEQSHQASSTSLSPKRKLPRLSMDSAPLDSSTSTPNPTIHSPYPSRELPISNHDQNATPSKSSKSDKNLTEPLPEEVYDRVEAEMAAIFGEAAQEEVEPKQPLESTSSLAVTQPTTSVNEKTKSAPQSFVVLRPVDTCPLCQAFLSIRDVTVNWRTGDFTAFCNLCGSRTVMKRAFGHVL